MTSYASMTPQPGDYLVAGGHRYRLTAVEDGCAWFGSPLNRMWVPAHSLVKDEGVGVWTSNEAPSHIVPGQLAAGLVPEP